VRSAAAKTPLLLCRDTKGDRFARDSGAGGADDAREKKNSLLDNRLLTSLKEEKMKILKYLTMLFVMASVSMPLASCSDDDDEAVQDAATVIAGDYSGNLSVMGYTDQYKAYVGVSRKSADAVAIVVDCDELNMHLSSVILDITAKGSSYELTSTSKAVSGAVVGSNLNLTFSTGSNTFAFYGTK